MKKLFAIVLMLVLIFSLGITSFAYPQSSTEMEALNEIEYWTWAIWNDSYSVFTENIPSIQSHLYNILSNILDVNDFTRSIYSEIKSLNNNLFGPNAYLVPLAETLSSNLSSLNDEFILFSDSFFNNISWGEPFAEVVQNNLVSLNDSITTIFEDVHQLKEVLADDEDLLYKESQKANQESAFNSFFSSSSVSSLSPSSFTGLSNGFADFSSYLYGSDISSADLVGSSFESGLAILRGQDPTGSDAFFPLAWFSEATAADIDLVSSFYSIRDDSESVTDYYSQQRDLYLSFFGRGD